MQRVRVGRICAAVIALMALTLTAWGQNQGQGGGQNRRGGRRVSVATIPVETLDATLKLTPEQKTKIGDIQTKYKTELKGLVGEPGTPPNPDAIQKQRDLTRKAIGDIEALLTEEQKTKLPASLKEWTMLREVGIPLDALSELKLTSDQKKKITDIATDMNEKLAAVPREERREKGAELRKAAHEQVVALLTDAQKEVLQKHTKSRPGNATAGNA